MLDGLSVWELSEQDFYRLRNQFHDGQFELEEGFKIPTEEGSDSEVSEGPTKVINIEGRITPHTTLMTMLMGGTSVDEISSQLDQAEENDSVERVVLNVNSPGGKATGIPSLTHKIRKMNTDTVTFATKMLSAAYHIGSASDRVVASPNALVGSIGVYALLTSHADKLEEEGIQTQVVRSVEGKAKGHPAEQLDEDSVKQTQRIVDKTHEEFVRSVAQNRNLSQDFVNNTMADGKVRVGEEAEVEEFTDDTITMEELFEEFEFNEEADESRVEQERAFLLEEVASAKEEITTLETRIEKMEEEEQQNRIEELLDTAIEEHQKFAPARREELRDLAEENFNLFKQMVEATPEGAAAPSDPVDTPNETPTEETQKEAVRQLEGKGLIPVETEEEAEVQRQLGGDEYNPETEEGDFFMVQKAQEYLR